MTVIRSLLILLTSVLFILVPYSWGHALSNHHRTPVLVGAGALVVAITLIFLLSRGSADVSRSSTH